MWIIHRGKAKNLWSAQSFHLTVNSSIAAYPIGRFTLDLFNHLIKKLKWAVFDYGFQT
jgi:hypothetical protein